MAKAVFAAQLDDIDDLIPPRPPAAETTPAAATPTDPAATRPTPAPQDTQSASAVAERPRRRRAATSVPTAEVAPGLHKRLRQLTTKERSRDPITARTYAQVVLDAIETHQRELETCWQSDDEDSGGAGLFSRRPAGPVRRRRHAEPPARVPLTGLNHVDQRVLDELVTRWNAPSRSALVEQALRLYLKVE